MLKGFDNDKYIALQAEHIRERIKQFGGKLYLEFGGKLFDDYHASRVLPGFEPDSKIRMLKSLADDAEIVITINANDIEKSKIRGDLGITYDEDVLRRMDIFRSMGFLVGSVVITCYANQPNADAFRRRLNVMGIKRLRQKRLHRNHQTARRRHRAGAGFGEDGDVPLAALPREPARGEGGLREI